MFFGTLPCWGVAMIQGCGELTFPYLKVDPPNRSDSRLLGKTPPPQPFRAGGTASLTQAFLSILAFGASPRRWPKARDEKSAGSVNGDTPFIYSTRDDHGPQFSPDGKRIAFVSNRSGNQEIWVCDSDASSPVQLTSFRGPHVSTPRWSPDGGRIAFDSNAEGEYDVWMIGANGGKPVRMTTHPANDGDPSWSRDGRWIYFDSKRTGEQQVWKVPADGGEAIQVTWDGGFAPLESPDGKSIRF